VPDFYLLFLQEQIKGIIIILSCASCLAGLRGRGRAMWFEVHGPQYFPGQRWNFQCRVAWWLLDPDLFKATAMEESCVEEEEASTLLEAHGHVGDPKPPVWASLGR
jgi:hypothetical protein